MKDITEDLIVLLEELYAKEKRAEEVVTIMQGESSSGPGFLNKCIHELELLLSRYLGGQKRIYTILEN